MAHGNTLKLMRMIGLIVLMGLSQQVIDQRRIASTPCGGPMEVRVSFSAGQLYLWQLPAIVAVTLLCFVWSFGGIFLLAKLFFAPVVAGWCAGALSVGIAVALGPYWCWHACRQTSNIRLLLDKEHVTVPCARLFGYRERQIAINEIAILSLGRKFNRFERVMRWLAFANPAAFHGIRRTRTEQLVLITTAGEEIIIPRAGSLYNQNSLAAFVAALEFSGVKIEFNCADLAFHQVRLQFLEMKQRPPV